MARGWAVLFVVIAIASPASVQAQASSRDTLAHVDSLIIRGELDRARASLRAWHSAHARDLGANGATRAHALYLNGLLAMDWKAAEDAFLTVALTHPTTPHASLALLRLGQGLLTAARAGDAAAGARASGYLQRLVTDYPTSSVRPAAFLWLAYAGEVAGRAGDACTAATSAAETAKDDETAALARTVRLRACGANTPLLNDAGLETFAVQIGAFRARESANELAARARAAGFDTRVVTIQGGSIFRVRSGSFPSQGDAARAAETLRRAGFDTAIVNDVRFETVAR